MRTDSVNLSETAIEMAKNTIVKERIIEKNRFNNESLRNFIQTKPKSDDSKT